MVRSDRASSRLRWHQWIKQQGRAIWLAWISLHVTTMGLIAHNSHQEYQHIAHDITAQANGLRASLSDIMAYAVDSLQRLQVPLEQADDHTQTVYAILLGEVDRGPLAVRWGWSGRDRHLRATSAHGIYQDPPDVSSRDYIHYAIDHPYDIYVTHVLHHLLTGREFIGVSMGFLDSDEAYLGTLVATISLMPLREMIARQMERCACDYVVFSPHGEVIAQRGKQESIWSVAQQQEEVAAFRVLTVIDSPTWHALINRTILQAASVLLLLNGVMFALYRLVLRYWVRPVTSALREIEPIIAAPLRHLPLHETMQRIGEAFHMLHTELSAREAQLQQTRQMLDALKAKQAEFLAASSRELSQMYSAIHDYACHLEEHMINELHDPDAPYVFDDVREMGLNLQFLSAAFARICEVQQGDYTGHQTTVDSAQMLNNALEQLFDAMQRRNLHLKLDTEQASAIRFDAHLLSLMLWAALYLAVRHAEDESTIAVTLAQDHDGFSLILHLSRYRADMLPNFQRDFSRFIRTLSFNESAAMTELLRSHVNSIILDSLLALCAGQWQIEAGQHYEMTMRLRAQALSFDDVVN